MHSCSWSAHQVHDCMHQEECSHVVYVCVYAYMSIDAHFSSMHVRSTRKHNLINVTTNRLPPRSKMLQDKQAPPSLLMLHSATQAGPLETLTWHLNMAEADPFCM